MRIKIMLFLLVGFNFCKAQTNFKKEIIGAWELTTKLNDTEIVAMNDPLINSDVTLTFLHNEVLKIEIEEFLLEATYSLQKRILSIGNRKFEIKKLENNTMFLTAKGLSKGIVYKYKRIKNNE